MQIIQYLIKLMKFHPILALAALLPSLAVAKEHEEENELTLDKLPAKVAEAIRTTAGQAEVEVEKADDEAKAPAAYKAEWEQDGSKHEITLGADGAILCREDGITQAAAPAPVQAALQELAKSGTLKEIEKITENNTVSYEAELKTADGKLEVKFDAAGKEIARKIEKKKDKEEEDDDDEEDGADDDHGHGDHDHDGGHEDDDDDEN